MDEHVVIEVIYVLGFREGLWHLLGLVLCALCISVNFLGLAVLPTQVCTARSLDLGAAAWLDLEARSPVPVCCISWSIRWSLKLTLLTALGSSLIAGFYAALHPKVVGVLPYPVGMALALLPPILTALGAAAAWTRRLELMNLSVRAALARRTFGVSLFGAVTLLTAWLARLMELQSNWTSCENLLAECSELANRGDCDASSQYFTYMMEHCKKACRACAMPHWGLGGDFLLVLHTSILVQSLRFAFLFYQSTVQLVIADSHLTEPETPFQALEEAHAPKAGRPRLETELVEAPRRLEGAERERGRNSQDNSRLPDPNEAARGLLAEHQEAEDTEPLPRVTLPEEASPEKSETQDRKSEDDDDASFYECESLAGD
ncbi:Protein-S-isoprenylcysteine O-methyltransferase [Durusdinium trenchii]